MLCQLCQLGRRKTGAGAGGGSSADSARRLRSSASKLAVMKCEGCHGLIGWGRMMEPGGRAMVHVEGGCKAVADAALAKAVAVSVVWILSSANLVQSRKNARFHPNLMAHSLKNQAYFSPSHTLIRKISRRGAEFSHPIDAKPCWSPCPWTRSPSHAWPAKIRFALSLGYNVCMSWQKNPGTCSTKPFLRATQR